MSTAQLKVDELAIHLIQRSTRANPVAPTLSEALTELNPQNQGFLQDRLRETLKRARPVIDDVDTGSPVPKIVRGLLVGGDDLLQRSRELAIELQARQAGISPSGLLLVARVSLDSDSGIVIAKWEHERGARTEQVKNAQGKLVYDMQFLEDLFMTETSRVYKVALFRRSGVSADRVEGGVIDPQSAGVGVAHYFRVDFLGCDYKVRPDVQTEQFHDAAQAFIDTIHEPEKRARYQVGLLSEMVNHKPEISVGQFARDHIDPEDRDTFAAHMSQRSVPLQAPVHKDLSLVKTRLRQVQIDFAHGAMVLAPPEEVGEGGHVQVEETASGPRVTITDEIAAVGGRGSVRLDGDGRPVDR